MNTRLETRVSTNPVLEAGAILPQSIEAEMSLLGALLVESDLMLEANYLQPADFFLSRHGCLFQVLQKLFASSGRYDYITVIEAMSDTNCLDEFGGPAGVTELMEKSFLSRDVESLAKIIYDKSLRRQVIDRAVRMTQRAYSETNQTGEEIVNQSFADLSEIDSTRHLTAGGKPVGSRVEQVVQKFEQIQTSGKPLGLQTRLRDLDRLFGGFQKNHNYLLAGRPGMGKSSLALDVSRKIAERGKRVLYFSLEMSQDDQIARLISQYSQVPYERYNTGQVADNDWIKVYEAADLIKRLPIIIDDTPGLTMSAIRNIAQREQVKGGLDLIVIDHVGIIRTDQYISRSYEKASQVADDVKDLPKQLNCPVLALLQLSRVVESRDNKRPRPSDLRDSGKWEENADGILFIYRDEVYESDTNYPNIAEVIVAKNRGGKTGVVSTYANMATCRFADLQVRSAL